MKKGRGENKDKLPIKKEGRENEKKKKRKKKKKQQLKGIGKKNIKVFMPESLTTYHINSVSLNMHTAQ